jgi:hypothetical protein
MATTKETANIMFVMLGIATVGLLAASVAKATGAKPGDILLQGEQQGGDGQLYQWRVIKSFPGAEFPFTGMAKLAGFGEWIADTIVAMGPNEGQTQTLISEYLAGLA